MTDILSRPRLFVRGSPPHSGAPTVTQELFSGTGGAFKAGYWASEPQTIAVDYDKDEICFLLEGVVVLTDAQGARTTYRKGDTFVIPRGFKGTWETVEPVQKFYALGTTT